jgi:hypothetical protein
MQPEHPFPEMPTPATSNVVKPTTYHSFQALASTAIVETSPSLPTHPPSSDSRTGIVGSLYDVPPKKWIVVDHDGAETWFSGHDGAWSWFMASPFASRLHLLTGGVRTLIGGLPYHPKPWHSNSLPIPFQPKFGATVACYTQSTICIGVCRFDGKGWRFFPNQTIPEFTGNHKPGVKFHPTYQACIPAWATSLITKWVLVEGK